MHQTALPAISQPLPAAYLEALNAEQRQAVEHGVRENDAASGTPLLVIAGAGSGKTNTLAHRVAHLIVKGSDPRRILLMTFSRRAAVEMARRVERIGRRVMGDRAGIMTDALTWSGTFHGIGARLLREYAEQIGLDPAFTIHDREDSADLMNLMRHELGFSKTESRFPTKGTCLAIYSRCVNAEMPVEDVLGGSYPWCAAWAAELRQLFAAYVEAKQRQNVLDYDDLLLYWAQMVSDPGLAEEVGDRFDHKAVVGVVPETRRCAPITCRLNSQLIRAPRSLAECAQGSLAIHLHCPRPRVAHGRVSSRFPNSGRASVTSTWTWRFSTIRPKGIC